jgi:riboflavin synthase
MFTGIVQGKGVVSDLYHRPGLVTLTVQMEELAHELRTGASVSVSGVCLTATSVHDGFVAFDVMQETLDRTTLGALSVGDEVNIERSAKFGDEIGGHIVSGHVSGTANIIEIEKPENNWILKLETSPEIMEAIFPKGFVAIDGASLTVVDVRDHTFTIHLIPETLARTTFEKKGPGDLVNVELDPHAVAIVQTVKRFLSAK